MWVKTHSGHYFNLARALELVVRPTDKAQFPKNRFALSARIDGQNLLDLGAYRTDDDARDARDELLERLTVGGIMPIGVPHGPDDDDDAEDTAKP